MYAGQLWKAEPLFERALTIFETAVGPEDSKVAVVLANLAVTCYRRGDFKGVRPLFERALAIREKSLEPKHVDVADTLGNLAILDKEKGEYRRAQPDVTTNAGAATPGDTGSVRAFSLIFGTVACSVSIP